MDRGLYPDRANVPEGKDIHFRFAVDAGNAPTLAASPLNVYVTSVSRVSQGLYRITLTDTFKFHVRTLVALNVTGAGVARWAQPGPVVIGTGVGATTTIDILIVDNAAAVQNPPAAAADNYVGGTVTFCDIAAI
jgi:hypothetical protein